MSMTYSGPQIMLGLSSNFNVHYLKKAALCIIWTTVVPQLLR